MLAQTPFSEMRIPVISNTTAQIMPQTEVKNLLEKQVMSPVRFYESMATLKALGIEQIVEIGPGKVLSGFIKKIDKSLKVTRIEDSQTLAETIAALNTGG